MSNTTQNAFSIFDLPQSFVVDGEALEAAYIQKSTETHPDRFPKASSREKLILTLQTADINKAYEILKNPLKRGYHLLSITAPHLNADHEKTIKDPALLLEAMEDQEALDGMTDLNDIAAFLKAATQKSDETQERICIAFTNKEYEQAMLHLYRLRYYNKVCSDARKKQSSLSQQIAS